MEANELAEIAIFAMPLEVLSEADKGQVYGVLSMALRTLEAQCNTILAEADNEAAEARRIVVETQKVLEEHRTNYRIELDANRREMLAAQKAANEMRVERDAAEAESRRFQQTIVELQAENARLHRSLEERMTARIPGAVQVADTPNRIHYAAAQAGQLEP